MSSPFFTPLHPRRATVVTSNSGAKKRVSLTGTFSSSSNRIHRCRRHLQVSYRLLARHARKIFEKLVQRIPGREMLYEYLHRNPGALEHQRPTHDLRISRDHICLLNRSGPPSFGRFPAVELILQPRAVPGNRSMFETLLDLRYALLSESDGSVLQRACWRSRPTKRRASLPLAPDPADASGSGRTPTKRGSDGIPRDEPFLPRHQRTALSLR